MTLGIRKLIVLVLVAPLFLVANLTLVTKWLAEKGVIDWAKCVHKEYLTGTAISFIVVLLMLLAAPRRQGRRLSRRCPVCDHTMLGAGKYCSECGSNA
jgi:thiosulfate reductase cytochrome b subunit